MSDALCESGWTGDRCQLPLDHEGPHDNEGMHVLQTLQAFPLPGITLTIVPPKPGEDGATIEFTVDDIDGLFLLPRQDRNGDVTCIGCGASLRPSGLLLGTFRWGLANGEGYCCRCGWPVRVYHRYRDEAGLERVAMLCLQYHPDFLERRSKK